jgi:hydroxymethylpyrimidine/phosphomethylpyrimidine kinase
MDVLWTAGENHLLPAERVDTTDTHGTGCVFSAAITARLAKGEDLVSGCPKTVLPFVAERF